MPTALDLASVEKAIMIGLKKYVEIITPKPMQHYSYWCDLL